MFTETKVIINKHDIVIKKSEITLVQKHQSYIEVKNPNECDINLKISSYYGFISVQKDIFIAGKKTVQIPFTVVATTKDFEDIVLIEDGGVNYKIYIKYNRQMEGLQIDEDTIFTLKQLYNLYLQKQNVVTDAFFSIRFKRWLENNYLEAFHIYKLCAEDTKADRVLENFFYSNNLKEKCEVYFKEDSITIDKKDGAKVIDIVLCKTVGYCEEKISVLEDVDFLTFEKTKIRYNDFLNEEAVIKAVIDFSKVSRFGELVHLVVGDKKLPLEIKSDFGVSIKLSKTILRDGDVFYINIKNNNSFKTRFVFRNTLNYFKTPEFINVKANENVSIPVDIAFTKLQKASSLLYRAPYVVGEISYQYNEKGSLTREKTLQYKILLNKVGKDD